jgi:hypothetical protein
MPTETVEVPAYLIDELVAAARHAVAVLPDSRGGGEYAKASKRLEYALYMYDSLRPH